MARSRWPAPLLFVLLLAGFAAGIWGSYRDVYPGKGLFRLTGIFEGRGTDTLILVSHDAAPGVMDEMRKMAFSPRPRRCWTARACVAETAYA